MNAAHLGRAVIGALLLLAALGAPLAAAASPPPPPSIEAELGGVFTLKKGQTARLRGLDASLRLIGFINSPCPKNARCFWSGLAVRYELVAEGKTFSAPRGLLPPQAPLSARVKASDYKSYAAFVVEPRL